MNNNPKLATKHDQLIGKKIKELRASKLVKLYDLAKAIKVSFQQLQKYEQGLNRVPASRLWNIADFLDVDIKEFQPDLDRLVPVNTKNQQLVIKLASRLKIIDHKEYIKSLLIQTEIIINLKKGK